MTTKNAEAVNSNASPSVKADLNQENLRKELSDEQFIAWSKSTFEDSYDVVALVKNLKTSGRKELTGLDIGGGIGTFAKTVVASCTDQQVNITVVDPGVEAAEQRIDSEGVDYVLAPFDAFETDKKYDFIIFRTVLHHLISDTESKTYETQLTALAKAKSLLKEGGFIFLTENFYEPWVGTDTTSRLIYAVTSSKAVAGIARKLGANTAGEGVRFRSSQAWKQIYDRVGMKVESSELHPWWGGVMPFWQKVPLLCQDRYQAAQILTVTDQ